MNDGVAASTRISGTPTPGWMWERALDSRCDENDGVGALDYCCGEKMTGSGGVGAKVRFLRPGGWRGMGLPGVCPLE